MAELSYYLSTVHIPGRLIGTTKSPYTVVKYKDFRVLTYFNFKTFSWVLTGNHIMDGVVYRFAHNSKGTELKKRIRNHINTKPVYWRYATKNEVD